MGPTSKEREGGERKERGPTSKGREGTGGGGREKRGGRDLDLSGDPNPATPLVNSFVSFRTRLTSSLWTTISGGLCLNATSHFNPAGEYR